MRAFEISQIKGKLILVSLAMALVLLQGWAPIQAQVLSPIEEEAPHSSSAVIENPKIPVLFREKPAFFIFYVNEADKESAVARARKASAAIDKAIKSKGVFEDQSKLVELILLNSDEAMIKVRGYKVIDLSQSDALAAQKRSVQELGENLKEELEDFVQIALSRQEVQRGALQFFLAVFFALMGFVTFRYVHQLFDRAEGLLEERRESFKPLALLSETLVSGQTLGGLLAFSIVVGRMLAYMFILLTTLAAILGQFVATRKIMTNFFTGVVTQLVRGLQALLEAIPGLLLASALVLGLQLAVKILDLFLKGVRSGRISWSFLNVQRIPVIKFWGLALIFSIFGPLIVASVFGQFHTPIELILIIGAAIFILSQLPMLVSMAVGSFIIWQDYIKLGQWVRIGPFSGEVTDISAHKITLVPEEGGRIFVPMFVLLYQPCVERKNTPQAEFRFTIQRLSSLENTLKTLEAIFSKKLNVDLFCLSISANEFRFGLLAPKFETDVRALVMSTLSHADEEEQIKLSSHFIEEVSH